MRYIKIQFTKGLECTAYQEVDDRGYVVRYLDDQGNAIDIDPELPTESVVLEESDAVSEEAARLVKVAYVSPNEPCQLCGRK